MAGGKAVHYICDEQSEWYPDILMVHGRGFNWPLPDHFRIVYLPKIEELKIACDRLGDFLEGYRQA